jgi:hypothetical protein
MHDTDTGHIGWPYTERSCLIDPDAARSIRAWALKEMTEAQLNSYSQRQAEEMCADMERRGSDVPDLMGALDAH